MYWSEIKLLLEYLIYKCNHPKTYGSLSLTCKYAFGLSKYYAAMKREQFCKKVTDHDFKEFNDLNETIYYVLPNGRILKSISYDNGPNEFDIISTNFDVSNNTSIECIEERQYGETTTRYNSYHYEYLYKLRENSYKIYIVLHLQISDLYLECIKCKYCKGYHTFRFYVSRNLRVKDFYLSSYCGLNLKYYLTRYSFSQHKKRRKIINSLIEYSKNTRKMI